MPNLGARYSSAAHGQTKRNSELDCEIWSHLPPELVARILALLPLTALIHTRLVSRRWDREVYFGRVLGSGGGGGSMIHNDDDGARSSWLFLFENGGPGNGQRLHAFDPVREDWQTVTTTLPNFATVGRTGGLSLCGAASGLMVLAIRALKSHFVRLAVFNPVTRSWKKLPPLLTRRQQPVVTMFMGETNYNHVSTKFGGAAKGCHYKVTVAGGMEYDQQVHTTEIYDSKAECWRTTCERFNNPMSHVCEEMRTSTAFCDGTLYHMRFNQMLSFDPQRENHTFMAYDSKTARWRPLRVPLPPELVFTEYPSLKRVWKGREYVSDVFPPVLVESNKRLLLIGFREDRPATSVAGAAIWEFVIARKTWKVVSAIPNTLFQEVLRPTVRVAAGVTGVTGVTDASEYLQFELLGAALRELVYVFRPAGGVLMCDLAHSPPTWRCIRRNVIGGDGSQSLQGCIIDLRLDALI